MVVVWASIYNKFDPTSPFDGYNESGSRLRKASGAARIGHEGGSQGLTVNVKLD